MSSKKEGVKESNKNLKELVFLFGNTEVTADLVRSSFDKIVNCSLDCRKSAER